ncbi:MAG: hypothetical protein K2O97_14230, partial [Acetatifactor sp.]|nr:hypothetical protein [Acetatifactor sp.]
IPSLAAQTIVPGTQDKTIANGQYLAGYVLLRREIPPDQPARWGDTIFFPEGKLAAGAEEGGGMVQTGH